MKRTLQELLDYAEECMDTSQKNWPDYTAHCQHMEIQSQLASRLALAVAWSSAVKYDKHPTEVDLSE